MSSLNRWIGNALIAVGAVLTATGLYLGMFAWLNDGPVAGVRLFGTTGAFGAAFAAGGFALRLAAVAHARGAQRRWWIQIGALLAGYVFFGLAATASSLLDHLGQH